MQFVCKTIDYPSPLRYVVALYGLSTSTAKRQPRPRPMDSPKGRSHCSSLYLSAEAHLYLGLVCSGCGTTILSRRRIDAPLPRIIFINPRFEDIQRHFEIRRHEPQRIRGNRIGYVDEPLNQP